MHKILQHRVPNDIGIEFYENSRLGLKARVPSLPPYRYQLSRYDGFFSVMGPSLWNVLPKYINCITQISMLSNRNLTNFYLATQINPLLQVIQPEIIILNVLGLICIDYSIYY